MCETEDQGKAHVAQADDADNSVVGFDFIKKGFFHLR